MGGGGGLESDFSVHLWSDASASVWTKLNNSYSYMFTRCTLEPDSLHLGIPLREELAFVLAPELNF